jgi:hypothetical protein
LIKLLRLELNHHCISKIAVVYCQRFNVQRVTNERQELMPLLPKKNTNRSRLLDASANRCVRCLTEMDDEAKAASLVLYSLSITHWFP